MLDALEGMSTQIAEFGVLQPAPQSSYLINFQLETRVAN
jgi:hypothetical protein